MSFLEAEVSEMCRLEVCGRNRASRASDMPASPYHQLQWESDFRYFCFIAPRDSSPHPSGRHWSFEVPLWAQLLMSGNIAGWWPGNWAPHGTPSSRKKQCDQGTLGTPWNWGTSLDTKPQAGGELRGWRPAQGDKHRSWVMAGWGCSQGIGQGQGGPWYPQPWQSTAKLGYHTRQPHVTCWFSFLSACPGLGRFFLWWTRSDSYMKISSLTEGRVFSGCREQQTSSKKLPQYIFVSASYITGVATAEQNKNETEEYIKGVNKCLKQLVRGHCACSTIFQWKGIVGL